MDFYFECMLFTISLNVTALQFIQAVAFICTAYVIGRLHR